MLSFFFLDPVTTNPPFLIATVIGIVLSVWSSSRVHSTFARYQAIGVRSGLTGAQAAAAVCRAAGVHDIRIERVGGILSDHYDPRARVLRLSPKVHDERSVASIAVAAHEAGHAIQHAENYAPLGYRSALVPVASVGSRAWFFVFLIGVLLNASQSVVGPTLMLIGIGLFAMMVVFQLVTLPVEFDASRRAKLALANTNIASTAEEREGVDKVLDAAAMTYLAAAAASLLQLIALLIQFSGRRN